MSLLAVGVEGEAGTTMAPLGLVLALVLKFNGSNIPLTEWEERLESDAHLYQVSAQLIAKLAINSLKDSVHKAMMVLPEKRLGNPRRIVTCLEGQLGEYVMIPELRRRFFIQRQQEDGSLTHFAVAQQNLWKRTRAMHVGVLISLTGITC